MKKNVIKHLGNFGMACFGGFFSLFLFSHFFETQENIFIKQQQTPTVRTSFVSSYPNSFTEAAKKTVDAVVHIHSINQYTYRTGDFFDYFFYGKKGKEYKKNILTGSGSGVIITKNGYIVTNHHVIKDADRLKVTLNNRKSYDAKVIGYDASTDIAVLKIDEKHLPYITFSDSDNLKLGEWVLAVGNPFNLTSTVTAGIVSAKSRNVPVIRSYDGVNSFIQTDAVVNPGNSGGALVNTKGDLVGINTAISSQSGSYEGYSFAVPSNIAKKVVEDILEYGRVQRAYLGVTLSDIDADTIYSFKSDVGEYYGVYVEDVLEGGAAYKSGIKIGDIIVDVDGKKFTKASELVGYLAAKKIGQQVNIRVKRNGKLKLVSVKLKETMIPLTAFEKKIGADLQTLSDKEKTKHRIQSGVKVVNVRRGLIKRMGIRSKDIILSVQEIPVNTIEDIENIIKNSNSTLVIFEVYCCNGKIHYVGYRK